MKEFLHRMLTRLFNLVGPKFTVGFHTREEMVGVHRFESDFGLPCNHPLPFHFEVTWGFDDLLQWLRPGYGFLLSDLYGQVTVGGLATNVPCLGTLELRYFSDRTLRYDFEFTANARRYRFVGEKVNIRWWNLPVSHTTCFGRITEAATGRLVSTAVVFFRLRTIPRFLLSSRLLFSK